MGWTRVGVGSVLVFALGLGACREAPLEPALAYRAADAEARGFERARRWGDAARVLAAMTRISADDATVWGRLGRARRHAGQWDDAIAALRRALEAGAPFPENLCYDIAACHAAAGRADDAFAWLDRSIAGGFESRPAIGRDPVFAGLHDDARWARVVGVAVATDDPVAGWRSDLAHFAAEIERLHLDRGHAAPIADVRAAIAALHAAIPDLDESVIPVRMQRIARMLGNGHSVVFPQSGRLRQTELPLTFYWFPDGLHVIDAREGSERWIGMRVARIGRGEHDSFTRDLEPIVSRDNAMAVRRLGPDYLRMTAYLTDLGYVTDVRSIDVTLVDREERAHVVAFEPVALRLANPQLVAAPGVEAPLWLRRATEHYWHTTLDDGTVYVQFNRVRGNGRESIPDYARRLRRELAAAKPRHVILDLRHNNGGNNFALPEFLRTLIAFETSHDDARLFVLAGRGTFSAGQNLLNDIERLTHAVIAGEPSGSRPNMVGEDTEVWMPFSRTRASIGTRHYQDSFPGDERGWIAPDLPVPLTAEDHFAGRDPVLDTVLEVIGRS